MRFEIADITCPASTASTAPLEVALNFITGILIKFWIVIPDGHSGLTGIALGYAHQPIIPYKQPAFFSGNDEVIPVEWEDEVPGVAWSAFLCNNDLISHSWEVRFQYREVAVTATPTNTQPLDINAIEAAAVGAMPGGY